MDIVIKLLLWLHIVALALGGAAAFGIPVVGSKMPTAAPETRPLLFKIMHGLSMLGRIGVGVLLVTGPLIIWLKYGGFAGVSVWFWIKMVFVLALLAGIIYAGILAKRAEAGDRAAAQMSPRVGMFTGLMFVCVMFSAVFAFQ